MAVFTTSSMQANSNPMRDGGLLQLFRKHLPEFHWQSVETWSTGQGVPDVNYCHANVEGWLELKRVTGWRITVSPEQIAWAERRARAGGRVFLACRRIESPQRFWLFRGIDARSIGSLQEPNPSPLVTAEGPPGSWPWPLISTWLSNVDPNRAD
jgi:hypothetical protein